MFYSYKINSNNPSSIIGSDSVLSEQEIQTLRGATSSSADYRDDNINVKNKKDEKSDKRQKIS